METGEVSKRHRAKAPWEESTKSLPVIVKTVPPRIGPKFGEGMFLTSTGTTGVTLCVTIVDANTLYSVPKLVLRLVSMVPEVPTLCILVSTVVEVV
jgi:hypothetical protein